MRRAAFLDTMNTPSFGVRRAAGNPSMPLLDQRFDPVLERKQTDSVSARRARLRNFTRAILILAALLAVVGLVKAAFYTSREAAAAPTHKVHARHLDMRVAQLMVLPASEKRPAAPMAPVVRGRRTRRGR
jgi:hypothetical protein